jgi:hypothetical protein
VLPRNWRLSGGLLLQKVRLRLKPVLTRGEYVRGVFLNVQWRM